MVIDLSIVNTNGGQLLLVHVVDWPLLAASSYTPPHLQPSKGLPQLWVMEKPEHGNSS